ncbi:DUF2809 domain-containing protein [Isoptericola sp. NPDC057191]|uniref:DUF2809 domain-containing protein n=1 Tax=Isoptericola sp. NPDC057191 TaxID=3346041 RepID=UPI00363D5D24
MSTPVTAVPRTASALLALLVVLLGLGARLLLPAAVGGPVGDALYATLVVLLVALVRPRTKPAVAALVGLVLCGAVELAQATGVPAEIVARVPVARFVLGTTFVPTDLAWYAAGAAAGGAVVALVASRPARVDGRLRHVSAPPDRRSRRARVVVPVVVVLLLGAAGGALAWVLHDEASALTTEVAVAQETLDDSADRVADDTVRPALAASIDRAEALLGATPLLERRPGDADTLRAELARDAEAVQRSRLEHARAQVTEARESLAPVTRRAEQILSAAARLAADGQGAGDAVRTSADDALATAQDALAATSDEALDSVGAAGAPAVEAAAASLGASRDDLGRATTDLLTAQDAVVCPEPDQVWFPETGRLADDRLAEIPWASGYRVRSDVLDGLVALDDAYRAEFGTHLTVNSAYRSHAQQVAVYDPEHPNPLAAPPGCSNHGLGTAVDLSMGPAGFDSPAYAWLKKNAGRFGWTHPDWAEPDGRLPEPWHWQSEKTPVGYGS